MRQQAAEDYHNQMLHEKQELESRLNQYESELNNPDNIHKSKTSFHNMDKEDFEARLQDVKQCSYPDFGIQDTSLIESIIGAKNFNTAKNNDATAD